MTTNFSTSLILSCRGRCSLQHQLSHGNYYYSHCGCPSRHAPVTSVSTLCCALPLLPCLSLAPLAPARVIVRQGEGARTWRRGGAGLPRGPWPPGCPPGWKGPGFWRRSAKGVSAAWSSRELPWPTGLEGQRVLAMQRPFKRSATRGDILWEADCLRKVAHPHVVELVDVRASNADVRSCCTPRSMHGSPSRL